MRPIYLADGFHCSDLSYSGAYYSPQILQIWRTALLETFPEWIASFKPASGRNYNVTPKLGGELDRAISSKASAAVVGNGVAMGGVVAAVMALIACLL